MAFTKVLVEEVINDVSYYTKEILSAVAPRIINKRSFCDEPPEQPEPPAGEEFSPDATYYLRAPRGSILGRPYDDAASTSRHEKNSLTVYYPFFASHFCLPVKPGEHVWTFMDGDTGYWVTRVCEPDNVEDPNFTHGDRILPVVSPPVKFSDQNVKPESPTNDINRIPAFPNGKSFQNRDSEYAITAELLKEYGDQAGKWTLKGLQDYQFIHDENVESQRIVYEPVPRLTKRPGDLVLQGSNNTSITLGTERGYTSNESLPTDRVGTATIAPARPTGTATNADPSHDLNSNTMLTPGMGAIDIVAGRGRIQPSQEATYLADGQDMAPPTSDTTRPRIVKNIRENFETDKNIGLDNPESPNNITDVSEGDPDFRDDASRLYISMKSSPDDMLNLTYPSVPSFPALDPTNPNAGGIIEPAIDSASIIVKSDEVRIVARMDDPNTINGSIKLVKEGLPDDETGKGRAVIALQPDGTIVIDGPKVVIGSGVPVKDNGSGTQVTLGVGAVESLVLGEQLQGILSAIIKVLDNHIHPTGTGPSGPRVPGADEALTGTFLNTTDDITDLKLMLSTLGKTL